MGEWSYSADVQELNGIIQRIRKKLLEEIIKKANKKTVSQLEKERDTEPSARKCRKKKKLFLSS
jgi:hypothetical protein